MSAQYLYASSLLTPKEGNQLNEVVIKGKIVKSFAMLSPAVPWVVAERGLEISLPLESLLFPQLKTLLTVINLLDLVSKSSTQTKGERNQAGSAGGTNNPFKKLKPDPNKPGNVLENDSNGATRSKKHLTDSRNVGM